MSFAAEPYGVFVDDLLTALTGGIVREEFVFLPDNSPFRLGFAEDVVVATVRLHGLVEGVYHRFMPGSDLTVKPDGTFAFSAGDPGVPAAGAVWPDLGSRFSVSYERIPGSGPAPRLTDRNPGSVTRTLAEAFAREYSVLSRQLESVYRAGFLATAEGRDLDQVVALVGVDRRSQLVAAGEVVFARSTPAPADISIPAGTRLSTREVPAVTVETSEARTLRAGSLSVGAPVRSLTAGVAGIADAATLTVIHRPILGIESASNSQALAFGGGSEDDASLRRRAARALETGGRATVDAIVGALTAVEGIREQDVLVAEDHVASPGMIKVTIAAELDADHAREALERITTHRPAGVRVIHNLLVPAAPAVVTPPGSGMDPSATPPGPGVVIDVWYPIGITAAATPSAASLTAAQKDSLRQRIEAALAGAVAELGIGAPVVYNRLVGAAMAVDGLLDISFDLYPLITGGAKTGRRNLITPGTVRPRLDELVVDLRGALVAIDLTVEVQHLGLAASGDTATELEKTRIEINTRLATFLAGSPNPISVASLTGALTATDRYQVGRLGYAAEFIDDGLKLIERDVELSTTDDQPWIRALTVVEKVTS